MNSDNSLLDHLFERRDEQRRALRSARLNIREEEAVVERNRNGVMRWYLHPDIPGAAIDSMIVYRHEIPPRGRTGRQLAQGNIATYVLSGHGRIVVNGEEHAWETGDVIGLPPLRDGVTYQHFNDSDETALLITAEPNLIGAFGVDMGSGFEQVEDAPAELEDE